jgi:endonuclease YncB( thermonuclease family)
LAAQVNEPGGRNGHDSPMHRLVIARRTARRSLLLGLLLLPSLLVLPAAGQSVTDGDTIRHGGVAVRLWGIDAAEFDQSCADGWAAGRLAREHLAGLMRDRTITCEPRTTDRYGRVVALCRADGEDLGAAMVSAGMAWAFIRYSQDYAAQEEAAASQGLGVHDHECERPWVHRTRQRRGHRSHGLR